MIRFLSQNSTQLVLICMILLNMGGAIYAAKHLIKENKELLIKDVFSAEFIWSTIFGFIIIPILFMIKIGDLIENAKLWEKPLFVTKERKVERILFSKKELKRRDEENKDDDYYRY